MGVGSSLIEEKRYGHSIEFIRAATAGNIEMILLMLQSGVSINCTDRFGLTALHWACHNGELGSIKTLLENGAETTHTDLNGRTSLHHACAKNHVHTVRYLLTRTSIDINAQSGNGDTSLHKAVRSGSVEVTKLLLSFDADPNIQNDKGNFVLDEVYAPLFPNKAPAAAAPSTTPRRKKSWRKPLPQEIDDLEEAQVETMSVDKLREVANGGTNNNSSSGGSSADSNSRNEEKKVTKKSMITMKSAAKRVIHTLQLQKASSKDLHSDEISKLLIKAKATRNRAS